MESIKLSKFIRECICYYCNVNRLSIRFQSLAIVISIDKEFVQINEMFFECGKIGIKNLTVTLPFIVENWNAKIDYDLYANHSIYKFRKGRRVYNCE